MTQLQTPPRGEQLKRLLKERILVLDGAMGTAIQACDLSAEDFGGESLAGCNEYLVLTKPELIQSIHESYLEAGADILETNTFGATPLVLAEYDIAHLSDQINTEAVRLARAACDKWSTPEKPRFVAGAVGPTTKSLSVTGGVTFEELAETFAIQIESLVTAGADYLLLETALDTLNLKAAYIGALRAFEKVGIEIPVAISGTIETMGTMLAGQTAEAMVISVAHMKPLYVGLNCATGPAFMKDHIRSMDAVSEYPVAVAPNAGIPDADGVYPESPEELAAILKTYAEQGWLNMVGGCCGTTPAHIAALVAAVEGIAPRNKQPEIASRVTGIESLVFENDGRPYIVGERTNVIGSRAFKKLIVEEKFEEAAEIARKQVRSGAHVIDACLSNPDRDEVDDIRSFMSISSKLVKAPFMIDSQMADVVETAFQYTQGKCILNSVNLEDDGKAIKALVPIAKRYGAALVVGCIAEEMAVTAAEKLDVAITSHKLLTEEYGIPEEDLIFDPLVFPCGTGDEKYFGSGKETIEGIRLIKEKYPKCKTVLGISNVSFGLPGAGREVLNAVFLYHCTKAGLDMAIVNAEKLVRYANITDEEKQLCNDLIWYNTENGDPIAKFATYFRQKKPKKVELLTDDMPVEKRLEINIVQGTKEGLLPSLDLALKQWDPLGVINGPLMAAMSIVGRMFNDNELIVAEVLQSAEVMKAAVAYLESFMEKGDINIRGKMLLATVKGDVHDIGKNLVQIILGNNGFHVIDLGIKCPPETLIQACKEHQPDLIGLSGLLVKSAQQMIITATDLKAAGIRVPILVGGAALTENFTLSRIQPEYDGAVVYCKDAMTGLAMANKLMEDPNSVKATLAAQAAAPPVSASRGDSKRTHKEKLIITHDAPSPTPPDFERHILRPPITELWKFLNLQMVYGNHMGYKGNVKKKLAEKDPKIMALQAKLEELKQRIVDEDLLKAEGVYRFVKVKRDGDSILVYEGDETTYLTTFTFPRQSDGMGLCLADFVPSDHFDTMAMFVLTCGQGVSDLAKDLMDQGEYFDSHALSAIALESAEAFSEYMHTQLRSMWGIPDAPDLSIEDIFKLKYRGVRVSFGYPACPRLEDQAVLWPVLTPDDIGISLSEEYMMHPEASVSALVFHHPMSRYFTISEDDLDQFEAKMNR
jgi:5-methyltetrahydrofolate--homocysteine methyltransferase